MSEPITSFDGPWRFLSNFYLSPVVAHYWRLPTIVKECPSVEHAYQAMKAYHATDFYYICGLDSPGKAKREGRVVVLRDNWEQVKLHIMAGLLLQKFQDNPALHALLLSTVDRELIEGNTWGDRFWGVCRGQGENHLGKILMDVRALLIEQYQARSK